MRMRILLLHIVLALTVSHAFAQPETPEQKDKRIIAENNRLIKQNEDIARLFKAGNDAYSAKNYDEAIARYDDAINAAPGHPGLVAVQTNRSQALRFRAADRYNAAIKLTDAQAKAASQAAAFADVKASLEAAELAVAAIAKVPPTATAYDSNKSQALAARFEAMRVAVQRVSPKPAPAAVRTAFTEYLAAVTDPAKQNIARRQGATMLVEVESYDEALTEFKRVIAVTPDDPESLFLAGMSAAALAKNPEATQFLKRFLEIAPATHPRRPDATEALKYLN
jgi:tetratricopeptide (TPR) repeat protein